MRDNRDLWWAYPTAELAEVVHLPLAEPFVAVHGGVLPSIQVSYESWGKLAPSGDNAVLIVHPMTADCHATGEFAGQATGWWEALIGPGRAIDTDRHFVVCPNLIGGCYGTTGPRFPAHDGNPYLKRFPLLTPRDMMRVQRLFLEAIGVKRLSMVIGPSMGAMIAWEWAIEACEMVDSTVVVAAPLRTSPYQIGLNWLQRRAIERDITEDDDVARVGQILARGVGMLSYRSPAGLEDKFGRKWFTKPGSTLGERGVYNIESWLRHHGKRIAKRFDPYTYLLFSRAMDLHDVSEGRGDLDYFLGRVACSVLVIGISSDNLYPATEVKAGADTLARLGCDVRYAEIHSTNGHDAFLLDTDQIATFLTSPLRENRSVPKQ
jgi:homoserine O-acetyltransferase